MFKVIIFGWSYILIEICINHKKKIILKILKLKIKRKVKMYQLISLLEKKFLISINKIYINLSEIYEQDNDNIIEYFYIQFNTY